MNEEEQMAANQLDLEVERLLEPVEGHPEAVPAAPAPSAKKEIKPFDPLETEFTLDSPERLRERPDLVNRRFLIQYGNQYYRPSVGWMDKRSQVCVANYQYVLACEGNNYIIHVLREEPAEPLPEGKKCLLEHVLPAQTIQLLGLSPKNPKVRAMVHKYILVALPTNLASLNSIRKWIETEIDETKLPHRFSKAPVIQEFSCRCKVTQSDYGRCSYRMDEEGEDDYSISISGMDTILANNNDFNQVLHEVEENLKEDAYNEPPDMRTVEDSETTGDYESDEDAPERCTYVLNLRETLVKYLWENKRDHYFRLVGAAPPEGAAVERTDTNEDTENATE